MTFVIIAIFGYLLASAFFLGCVMLTARGKENGNRVTVPFKHSDARGRILEGHSRPLKRAYKRS
jgi:hypothetical protein